MRAFPKLFVILFAAAVLLLSAQNGFAQLTITPTTWNVIGLDSNDVNSGPNKFPVGAEVCNSGGTTIDNVTATFNWNSSNIYLNLESGNSINVGSLTPSLTPGSCTGVYFIVVVTRDSAAYDTVRSYSISVSGDGAGTVSTPSPREIYVERLISQGRNSTVSIIGPSTVYVGGTYTFTLNAKTATQGYAQLEAFLPFSSGLFQTLSIDTTYSAPAGATNDKFYADACGWENNPGSTNYRSCVGPEQYSGGKAGGTLSTTYTVKVVGTGTSSLSSLIYDFSGSSYHYNNDFGNQVLSVTALQPPNLNISKSHLGDFIKGQNNAKYSISVSNTGGIPTFGTVTVSDTLPTGLVPVGTTGLVNGWTCSIVGQLYTCNRSDSLAVGSSYPTIELLVNVATDAPSQLTNTAFVYGGGDILHSTLATAAQDDDLTMIVDPPLIGLSKTCPAPADCTTAAQLPNTELTYQIDFENTGGISAANLALVDAIPDDTDFKLGTASVNAGTTGLTFVIEYSSDYNPASPGTATWVYIPVSGAGGADAGYDRLVKAIRWRVTAGSLSQTSPNNSGSVSFISKIR